MPRFRHYWRKRLLGRTPEAFEVTPCDAGATIRRLSTSNREALSWFERFIAFVTTPFKRFGIRGWKETGCTGSAAGSPVRDAQHSTDGFWTIDVALSAFSIGALAADLSEPRYLRLEVEPDTAAHRVCAGTQVHRGASLSFGGAVVIDTDANFLEIHPDSDFRFDSAKVPAESPGTKQS